MRHIIRFTILGSLLAGWGCQGTATIKQQMPDGSGMIELQAKGDIHDVIKLVEKQTGKDNYELTEVTVPTQPGDPNEGKKFYAFRKKSHGGTPAGLPPAPGGGIQQTGGTSLPIPQIPSSAGQQPRTGMNTGTPPASLGQPSLPATGRSSFAGDR